MQNLILKIIFAADGTTNATQGIGLPEDISNNSSGKATDFDLATVATFIGAIIDIAIKICLLAGIAMIIYASIMYLTAYGDDSKAETGKKTLFAATLGTIFVYLCQLFVEYLKKEFFST